MTTLFAAAVRALTPMVCTNPDGSTYTMDNPHGELPFVGDKFLPEGCVPGPGLAEQAIDAAFGPDSFKRAVAGFVKTSTTMWVNTPAPQVTNSDFQVSGAAGFLTENTTFYTTALMVMCIALCGAKIAWQQRGAPTETLFGGLIRFIGVTGFGAAVVTLVLTASDEYAKWIIQKSGGDDFAGNLNAFMVDPDIAAAVGNVGAYFALGLAIIVAILQVGLMFARAGALIVLVGTWPLSSSAASLDAGKQWFNTHTAWLVGFMVYKFFGATIYAGAFELMGTKPGPGVDATSAVLQGVFLMFLAILALPASVKIASSLTHPVATGRGAGAGLAAVGGLAIASRGR